ncbi:hypothetical protein NIES2135_20450 [Leptolyngbya boryana NIES-2135]|uniref:Uncharacterized protein n=1 Tax=Leptolyngbya boryana NIES-2135 TaxID=1973484 RepID=A0A1Z4JEM6_LEPBY|nr:MULTISPECIES: hypothetical protein [Leptolyngbya]BAY55222.1 hypothetical protein NIES2135_20450 [Leptolyngbya boryana NIES-2135]MBD2369309.1 hypothetical protein [Leptolyngbya sp. FACHB-161]MBD2375689.1 hypothetical protein [Leptolyngbya sp. FACHB-238]MBD2401038.1 hypothetical protein [Leptolyngbya sp. FACHB-239]MBD2406623.1 hypothetical protein [Leptolyngbya sp. FACHB-402]
MTQEFKTWATLSAKTPFNHLFPDRKVPIVSPIPIIPREEGMPFCYVVDAQFLTDEQIQGLAEMLYEQWKPESESVEETIVYIREGLPLKCAWFSSFTTIDPKMMAMLTDVGSPEDEFEPGEGEEEFDCGFVPGFGCNYAGSEDCDFDCPYRGKLTSHSNYPNVRWDIDGTLIAIEEES